jgi:hypothetical protein
MWTKLKQVWQTIVNNLGIVIAVIIGLLIVLLDFKNKKIDDLLSKISLTQTKEQADLLEQTIQEKLKDVNLLEEDRVGLNSALDSLNQQRAKINQTNQLTDPKDIEDFWSKN